MTCPRQRTSIDSLQGTHKRDWKEKGADGVRVYKASGDCGPPKENLCSFMPVGQKAKYFPVLSSGQGMLAVAGTPATSKDRVHVRGLQE